MNLHLARTNLRRVSTLLLVALPFTLSAFAQTTSSKRPDTSDVEPIPVIHAERSEALKDDSQATVMKNRKGVISLAATKPLGPRSTPSAAFTNSTPITITDCPNPCPASGQPASLYPAPIVVSGEVGVVQRVSVTLHGFSHPFPADLDFLLVSPSGRKSVLMSDFGAGSPGVSNINVTFDDYATQPVPSVVTGNTGVPFVSGSYRPANSGTTDIFPAPAPAGPYTYTMSAFNGDNPNGTWNLYIIDDANLDGGSITGGWTITFDARPTPPAPGQILISEFRARGTGTSASDGSADEFIELYNNTDESITIVDAVPGADPTSTNAGWRLGGAEGASETTFFVIPQITGTAGPLAIPARGYFLIATQPTSQSPPGNSYSLSSTATSTPNMSIVPVSSATGFLADNGGLAVFSSAMPLPIYRLDSVGYSSITNPEYKEGTGLSPAGGITTNSQHSWVRNLSNGKPQDTNDNAADFVLVDTNGATLNGIAAILGAPGPQRGPSVLTFTTSGAPIESNANVAASLIDPMQTSAAAPNRVRDFTPVTNGANGTLKLRRKFTNNTGRPIIALRYRIVNITTLTGGAVAPGVADLRVLNSPTQTITLTDASTVTSQALTLQIAEIQPNGGGLNSTLSEGVITAMAPLANGASTIVEFNLGVQVPGNFRFYINIEALTVPMQ